MMVSGILCGSVVAKTNMTCGGGSSRVFSKRVEGAFGEHMDFIDDVDLLAALGRHVLNRFCAALGCPRLSCLMHHLFQ